MGISDFDRWVGANNISNELEFSKGWWDYVEMVRRFAAKLETVDVRVVGHYVVNTPPPEEELPMPAVALAIKGVTYGLRFDFGRNPTRDLREWLVSVKRRAPYRGPLFGIIDPNEDLRPTAATGLAPDLLFGPYRDNQAEFTCALEDEWDVWTLMRLMAHEA